MHKRTYLFICSMADFPYVDGVRLMMARRGIRAEVRVHNQGRREYSRIDGFDVVLWFLPRDPLSGHDESLLIDALSGALAVVPAHRHDLHAKLPLGHEPIIDIGRPDDLLASLILAGMPALPSWLSCRVSEQVTEPTGVAWWNSHLLVCDAGQEAVLHLGLDGRVGHVMPGLNEPHHIHLDRRILFVANTGESTVLRGTFRPKDGIGLIDDIGRQHGIEFNRPHGVWAASDILAVADTDNQRVMLGLRRGQAWTWTEHRPPEGFWFPCGVHLLGPHVWVTNSDIGAIDHTNLADPSGRWLRIQPGPDVLRDPNALARWQDLLFIADEVRQRLVVAKVNEETGALSGYTDVAEDWIGSPWGLSVNAGGHLAVSDRLHGVVWTVDVPRWMSEWSRLSGVET